MKIKTLHSITMIATGFWKHKNRSWKWQKFLLTFLFVFFFFFSWIKHTLVATTLKENKSPTLIIGHDKLSLSATTNLCTIGQSPQEHENPNIYKYIILSHSSLTLINCLLAFDNISTTQVNLPFFFFIAITINRKRLRSIDLANVMIWHVGQIQH